MDKLQEYKNKGYVIDNPENESEVIWNIPIIVKKEQILNDAFVNVAHIDGWNGSSSIDEVEFCTNQIKEFINRKHAKAGELYFQKQAAIQYAAWLAAQE